jgi:threonine dehydratase
VDPLHSDAALSADAAERLAGGEPARVRAAIRDVVRHTPVLTSRSLSSECGGEVLLKAENLQRTGSFKLRGALSKIGRVDPARGVVAGSAGNHAQSLAYAARERGIACEVFMPDGASVSKVAAVRSFGGTVHVGGAAVDECVALAREHAEATGATFVHPFDDPDVVVGQGTLGVELLEDVPRVGAVVVPLGGGGLISGVAGVLKAARPEVRVVGVQVESCAPFRDLLTGRDLGRSSPSRARSPLRGARPARGSTGRRSSGGAAWPRSSS